MKIRELIGSGDKIILATLPFLAVGLALNIFFPAAFAVGGPSPVLRAIALIMLVFGVIVWLWSVVLVLTKVPRKKLITTGPYALVKHPLYTSAGLLVLPSIGFLVNTWLGAVVGIVIYIGSRLFAPDEEALLSKTFGAEWDEYRRTVKLPWL